MPTASDDGPPLPPDAAHGLTIAAAEETVRFFYLEAENYLKRTGIGAAVTRASDPSCAACQHAVTYFRTRNGANRQLGGDYLWRGADIRMVRMTGARTAVVDVNVQTGRHTAVEKRGSAPKAFKGGTNYFKVSLLARGGRWIVFEVEFR